MDGHSFTTNQQNYSTSFHTKSTCQLTWQKHKLIRKHWKSRHFSQGDRPNDFRSFVNCKVAYSRLKTECRMVHMIYKYIQLYTLTQNFTIHFCKNKQTDKAKPQVSNTFWTHINLQFLESCVTTSVLFAFVCSAKWENWIWSGKAQLVLISWIMKNARRKGNNLSKWSFRYSWVRSSTVPWR